jgi:hypothetical protein
MGWFTLPYNLNFMLATEVLSPLKGLLRNFNPILSKPQQDNLARIIAGMLVYEGEKYVSKINCSFNPLTRTRVTSIAS